MKSSINFTQIFPENSQDYTNSVWIEIVGIVYRSPNSPSTNNEKLLCCLNELGNRNVVIMGDFNHPGIDWENLSASRDSSEFFHTVMDNFLHQHVKFPTRENNTLDLILTSDPNFVESVECIGKLGSSDHILLLAKVKIKNEDVENSQQIPDWKKANMDGIKESLNRDWSTEFSGKDTEASMLGNI